MRQLPARLALAAFAFALPAAEPAQDAKAVQVADRVMAALGGQKAWEETRFLRFTFAGRRTHTWDKWTGRHRLEGKNQEGASYVVLQNVNTKQGEAWVNGQKAAGEEAAKLLENAYGAWVNDTYWLLAPYKLRDPGVNLAYAGEETSDGRTYDKLALSFGQVGLTPGDRYWMYVDRATGRVDRWEYVLQNQPADSKPTAWRWEGWAPYGKIRLAPTRAQVGGDRKLELTDLAVLESVPDSVFTSPGPAAPPPA